MFFIYLALTYLLASTPFALVITTLHGGEQDVRTFGSGNIGATNVARLYGWSLALPVLLLDMFKGWLPVALAGWLWPELGLWATAMVALVAFVGHCFPIYLEFRGGKGVATGAGALLPIVPKTILGALVTWGFVLLVTGRSSVAALTASLLAVGFTWWFRPDALGIVLLIVCGVVWTHLANLRRMFRGEEKQVIRPVRFSGVLDAEDSLRQDPSGANASATLWGPRNTDPLGDIELPAEE